MNLEARARASWRRSVRHAGGGSSSAGTLRHYSSTTGWDPGRNKPSGLPAPDQEVPCSAAIVALSAEERTGEGIERGDMAVLIYLEPGDEAEVGPGWTLELPPSPERPLVGELEGHAAGNAIVGYRGIVRTGGGR